MKIVYLVNKLSKTSVPASWESFINASNKKIKINTVSIIKFKMRFFYYILKADVVNGHHIKATFLFLIVNYFLRKKTVYTVHGSYSFLSAGNKILLRFILKHVNKVVFVNKNLHDVLPNDLKEILESKYKIILNGVDLAFKYEKEDMYLKYDIDSQDRLIFHPARFVEEKNHSTIIKSFKLFLNHNPHYKLILAGDGKLKGDICNLINDLDLADDVLLTGLISKNDVYNFLDICELFIMPSLSEGLNIAFLEALSMKSKVVVSDIKQFIYPFEFYRLNSNDFNVFFANPGNAEELSNVFARAVEAEKNEALNLSAFSLDNMISSYHKVYKELF